MTNFYGMDWNLYLFLQQNPSYTRVVPPAPAPAPSTEEQKTDPSVELINTATSASQSDFNEVNLPYQKSVEDLKQEQEKY